MRTVCAIFATRSRSSRAGKSWERFSEAAATPNRSASCGGWFSWKPQTNPAAKQSPQAMGLTIGHLGRNQPKTARFMRGQNRFGSVRDDHPLGPLPIEFPHRRQRVCLGGKFTAHGAGEFLVIGFNEKRPPFQGRLRVPLRECPTPPAPGNPSINSRYSVCGTPAGNEPESTTQSARAASSRNALRKWFSSSASSAAEFSTNSVV